MCQPQRRDRANRQAETHPRFPRALDRCATAAAPITETPEFIEAVARVRADMHAQMRAVEAAEVTHRAFLRCCGEDWRFAVGWNEDKVLGRLCEIFRFAMFNSRAVIPFRSPTADRSTSP
jgi:hypothetical protein